ncbi:hypothetical protein HYFRA_00011670 [Hymenoscyphus fraxineus]|uniref:Uncharacterized protein n=1 Tax=Hymenoscyphus fraxineus TaxID=746836 RepID=A0A9N9KZB4_9HELO|nr:hypothetical protein HYFRA_00011670 [Hymenoscyphus fraxineus]
MTDQPESPSTKLRRIQAQHAALQAQVTSYVLAEDSRLNANLRQLVEAFQKHNNIALPSQVVPASAIRRSLTPPPFGLHTRINPPPILLPTPTNWANTYSFDDFDLPPIKRRGEGGSRYTRSPLPKPIP